ncbi:MAG: linear amide C-N hydrolase, partial [Synergistaceae bacterium]|nr:linear amide C-N hydrolase [Synergistaceae bacterium]
MKKKFVWLLAAVIVGAAVFCFSLNKSCKTDCSAKPAEAMKVEKVSEYLYKIRYNDIDYSVIDNWSELMEKSYKGISSAGNEKAFACTAVVNGNIYGRNLDFFIGQYPEFIVWVDGKEGRYASMAVGSVLNVDRKEAESGKLSEDTIRMLPFMIYDGINEKGVACNMNYVPKDVKHDSTNPKAEELPYFLLIRYVLDNAASAAEGVELLKGRNLVDKPALSSLHWIIADPKESYLIEIVDNEMRVVKNPKAMTNYYRSIKDYTPHACGIERMDIVNKNYDKANTVEGMSSLLQSVHYTQAYKKSTNPFWYSEHYQYDSATGKDYTVNTPKEEM